MSVSGISSNNILSDFFRMSGRNNGLSVGNRSAGWDTTAAGESDDVSANAIGTDLNTLLKALESGNLSTAQTSYSQLLQDIQSVSSTDDTSAATSSTTDTGGESNPLAKDMTKLGDAISSGDLTSAQNILGNIMRHMQGPPPPPPDMNAAAQTDSRATDSDSSSSTLANDLKALNEALSSGDQASVISSYSQLLQDLQSTESTSSSGSTTASTSDTASTSSQYNDLLRSFLQILTSLTNTQVNMTHTVA